MTALGSTSPMGTRTGVLAIPPESGASRKLRFGTPVAGGSTSELPTIRQLTVHPSIGV